ncbi:MAG TPA: BatD family protein [Haliscomenobacter sp.]|uniref:BatD family protein n=1 Tax=Haliscomenobacter sp. TaxID=2717303 RepID=UPI002BD8623B|nr:BatD family protein [Haliscomenobacter sp.]HOY15759.1 BatD family protein [Haliscomenobacter sp.]
MSPLRPFFIIFGLLFCANLSWAQRDKPDFRAFADAKQVLEGSFFEVTFALSNAEGTNFKAPSFGTAFTLISGPSRSASTTIVNGRMSSEMAFSYALQAKKIGTYSFGPATVEVNGKILRSNSVTVEVVKNENVSRTGKAQKGEELFVKAILNAREAYLGQQVRLDYKVYTRVDLENFNFVEESDYVGFYVEEIQHPDSRMEEEIVAGVRYNTRILRSIALYPQKVGQLNIDAATLQVAVVAGGSPDPLTGLTFGAEIRRVPLRTEAVALLVKPLPPNPPASFSGGVGIFNMNSAINRTEVTTDDALTLRLTLTGDGDMKRVRAPNLNLGDNFEVYDPRTLDEEASETGGLRVSRKTVEYLIMPKKAGQYTIQPEFSFFNSESKQYETLKDYSYELRIRKGSGKGVSASRDGLEGLGDLHPLKSIAHLSKGKSPLFNNPLFWFIALAPFLAWSGTWAYQYLRAFGKERRDQMRLQKSARKVALDHLNHAEQHLQAKQSRDFYDAVSKAILGYLGDKLNIPKADWSKENISAGMAQLNVQPELVERLQKLLQNCEMALFAGQANATAMQETYTNALEILTAVEDNN